LRLVGYKLTTSPEKCYCCQLVTEKVLMKKQRR